MTACTLCSRETHDMYCKNLDCVVGYHNTKTITPITLQALSPTVGAVRDPLGFLLREAREKGYRAGLENMGVEMRNFSGELFSVGRDAAAEAMREASKRLETKLLGLLLSEKEEK